MKMEDYIARPLQDHAEALALLRRIETGEQIAVTPADVLRVAAAVYVTVAKKLLPTSETMHSYTVDELGNRQYSVGIGEFLRTQEAAG